MLYDIHSLECLALKSQFTADVTSFDFQSTCEFSLDQRKKKVFEDLRIKDYMFFFYLYSLRSEVTDLIKKALTISSK